MVFGVINLNIILYISFDSISFTINYINKLRSETNSMRGFLIT
ncbi:hypothetical protein A464_4562 [Salmonella bongori N268-08]|uniref:Uncharacterized protein n=1 Tax=Salmonella bongori N268-08 TaxID=1197719 RepID=S5N4D6_SALBN|nr:hypothetical protein A464_4562 [Salmonella bongori N268-08]